MSLFDFEELQLKNMISFVFINLNNTPWDIFFKKSEQNFFKKN